MPARILAIALNTFREAIRNRILYLLLVFAVALILCAQTLSLMTVGSEEKIIKDFGLATIDVFGVLTAVLLGIGLVSREIERRTVYVLLAKPIHRAEFVLGKYVGLVLTLLVNTGVMAVVFFALLMAKGMADPSIGLAIVMLYMEFLLSAESAKLVSENFEQSLRPDVVPPPGAKSLSEVKVVSPTSQEITQNLPGNKEKWKETFGM